MRNDVNQPRVFLQSLGCKTNQYENDALAQAFVSAGFTLALSDKEADVLVLNTCTVTAEAGRKSRQILRRLRKHAPEAILVASGCHAELTDLSEIADLTVGTSGRDQIVQAVRRRLLENDTSSRILVSDPFAYETIAPVSLPSETRAFIKIEDGCDNRCAYCAIRLARGPVRSRSQESIVHEIETLSQRGFSEFILTGTHIGAYGKDKKGQLIDLLERLDQGNYGRIRLGSLEPHTLTDAFMQRVQKLTSLCPHVHLSLQSGSDTVLRRMRRRYDSDGYRRAVERLLEIWPEAGLTTDVMVGFPAETEKEHQESVRLLQALPFTDFHVFRFSPREGTEAFDLPDRVAADISKARSSEMEALATVKRLEAIHLRLGKTRQIIVEKIEQRDDRSFAYGYTEDYLYVETDLLQQEKKPGDLITVKITGRSEEMATADLVDVAAGG